MASVIESYSWMNLHLVHEMMGWF